MSTQRCPFYFSALPCKVLSVCDDELPPLRFISKKLVLIASDVHKNEIMSHSLKNK